MNQKRSFHSRLSLHFIFHFGGALLLALIHTATTPLSAQSPVDTFRLSFTLPATARFATADNLGHIYLITDQNAIEKYAPDGRLLSRYTNNRLGNALWLDVANPLKVLVWYADFRTAVLLDRSLTQLGEMNLIAAVFPEVRTLAVAADGNLWIYDEGAFQIKKITPAGELLFESQALNVLQSERMSITCMRDDGNALLVADTNLGIFWFDVYAQFQKRLPWAGITAFVLEQNQLEYLAGGVLHIEHLQTFTSATLPLPASTKQNGAQCWLAPRHLLVQGNKNLEVWVH